MTVVLRVRSYASPIASLKLTEFLAAALKTYDVSYDRLQISAEARKPVVQFDCYRMGT